MSQSLFINGNIFTPVDEGRPLSGPQQGRLRHYPQGALLVENGVLVAVGDRHGVEQQVVTSRPIDEIDVGGYCLVPGFVDPHTHMCFAARREAEFELRLAGTPYLEILEQGGGILSSVRQVATASEDELYEVTRTHAESALKTGTTTLEIKSGYGLDTENELKMLVDELNKKTKVKAEGFFLNNNSLEKSLKECKVLIHSTPIGMHPKINDTLIPKKLLTPDIAVLDIVYNPLKTSLLKDAKAVGCKTIPGVEMFINQAVVQFQLWTQKEAPVKIMRAVVMERLGG